MAIQTINLGTYANDGTGDDLRSAFQKVNANILELYSAVYGAAVGAAPPTTGVAEGNLWWNTVDGRMYIRYGSAWIESSPQSPNNIYGISAETTTGGANIRLSGTDLSADDIKLASGTNITVAKTSANIITISSTIGSTSIDGLSDVDTTSVLPSTGQALVWNGSQWAPGAAVGGSLDFGTFTAPTGFTLDLGTF